MTILTQKLDVVCNGCGNLMRDMGEWPVQYPKNENKAAFIQQARRFACGSCRIPHPTYEKGIPIMFAILETADISGREYGK